jgi:hypothetical protein
MSTRASILGSRGEHGQCPFSKKAKPHRHQLEQDELLAATPSSTPPLLPQFADRVA